MSRVRSLIGAVRLLSVVVSSALIASQAIGQARATERQGLASEARVSRDAARITALSRVPGGRMSSIDLRRGPAGKLIYSALITEPGKATKTEVVIDAMTGAVISKRP